MTCRPVHIAVAFIVTWSAIPVAAFAQAGLPGPIVEIGVDASARAEGAPGNRALGPNFTVNLTPRTAIEASADARAHKRRWGPSDSWSDSQGLYVQLRRALYQQGGLTISATAGGGGQRDRDHIAAYSYTSPFGLRHVPAQDRERTSPLFVTGGGFAQRVSRHLTIRADAQLLLKKSGLYPRVVAGVSVPVGRYPQLSSRLRLIRGPAELRPGQHVWITTKEGREFSGSLGEVTDSTIEIRHPSGGQVISLSDVRLIQVPDRLADGMKIGAGTGAGISGGLMLFAILACGGECVGEGLLIGAAITSIGAATGLALGALVDSLHDGRRTVLDAGTLRVGVAPMIARRGAGLSASLRW